MPQHKGGIYTAPWNALKESGKVELQLTSRSDVNTIIRGIRDTKYRDREFHLMNGDIPWILKNSYNPITKILTVTLDSPYNLEGVKKL